MPPDRTVNPKAVLAIASATTFVAFLDVTVVNVAFPDLRRDFPAASLALLSWVVAAYGIAFAAARTPAGRLADVAGRREIFLGGVALFTVASAASALAPSVGFLIGARVVQGLGAALMIPSALGLVLAVTPPEKRSAAIAAWGAAGSVAAAAGPALGGLLVDAADWRIVFWLNVPLGVAVVAVGRGVLPVIDPGERRLPDLLGTIVLGGALALIVTGLTQAGEWGWGDTATLGALVAGALLLAAALARARTHPAPAIEVGLWRERQFAIANVLSLLYGIVLFAWLLAGTLFLVDVWRYSIFEAGLAMTPGALVAAVAAAVCGRLVETRGARAVVIAGAAILAADGLYLYAILGSDPSFLVQWLPAGIACGLGFGGVTVGITTAAARALPPAAFAAGIGLNMSGRQVGGAAGVAFLATILATAQPGPGGYLDVYLLCAFAAAAVAAGAFALQPAAAPAPAATTVPATTGGAR